MRGVNFPVEAKNKMAKRIVSDIMNRNVITIPAKATLREAAQTLVERGISGLPVVDEAGQLVGMLSEADILDPVKRQSALPRMGVLGFFVIPEEQLKRAYEDGLTLPVEKLMSQHVITVTPHTPITEVMRQMVVKKVNRLPVLDGTQLVGIVTREDVLRGLLETASEDSTE